MKLAKRIGTGVIIVAALIVAVLKFSRDDSPESQADAMVVREVPTLAQKKIKAKSEPITVDMAVTVASENPPVISGITNLPEGTNLGIWLRGDFPGCYPSCGTNLGTTSVRQGKFAIEVSSILFDTRQLVAGSYTIEVITPIVQPPSVQSIIGEYGENIRGQFVATLSDGKYVSVKFPRSHRPSDKEDLIGLMIHYTERVLITPDGKAAIVSNSN